MNRKSSPMGQMGQGAWIPLRSMPCDPGISISSALEIKGASSLRVAVSVPPSGCGVCPPTPIRGEQ